MVLVGDRSAEEGHDAVAHDLVHGAFKAVDRVHHSLEHGVEDPAGHFWVAVGEELHRALQVGEEDRHLLALTFERSTREEDAFGEMLRSVALGGGGGARCGYGGGHTRRMGAPRAKLGYQRQASATLLARARQGHCALLTEAGVGVVVVPAVGALHVRTTPASPPLSLSARNACPCRGTSLRQW